MEFQREDSQEHIICGLLTVLRWRYIYNGVYPNQDIGSKGAWHGAEIGMVFGTSEFLSQKVGKPNLPSRIITNRDRPLA
jgi:hypothetical protein